METPNDLALLRDEAFRGECNRPEFLRESAERCALPTTRGGKLDPMQALKVQVKNGRLVVDQPTDLPDGAEVEIVVIDDKLTAEERTELHVSLDRALDDSEADRSMDAEDYLKQYRARRADRPAR